MSVIVKTTITITKCKECKYVGKVGPIVTHCNHSDIDIEKDSSIYTVSIPSWCPLKHGAQY